MEEGALNPRRHTPFEESRVNPGTSSPRGRPRQSQLSPGVPSSPGDILETASEAALRISAKMNTQIGRREHSSTGHPSSRRKDSFTRLERDLRRPVACSRTPIRAFTFPRSGCSRWSVAGRRTARGRDPNSVPLEYGEPGRLPTVREVAERLGDVGPARTYCAIGACWPIFDSPTRCAWRMKPWRNSFGDLRRRRRRAAVS
jgi:hypothetical protein